MASDLDFVTPKRLDVLAVQVVRAARSDLINFACGEIMLSGQADVKKAFIVAQIQVHLQFCGAAVSM